MKKSGFWWCGLVGCLLLGGVGCAGVESSSGEGQADQAAAAPVAAPAPVAPPLTAAAPAPVAVSGEILVKLASSADADELVQRRFTPGGALQIRRAPLLERALQRHRVRDARRAFGSVRLSELSRVLKLQAAPADVDALVTELRATPGVIYAEPNRIHHVVYAPNDPFFASTGSWGQPYADLWGLSKIAASTAWNTTQGAGVIVAVVDTGVDYGHADIAANIYQNVGEVGVDAMGRDKRTNGVDDDGNGYVDDWHGYNFASGSPQAPSDPMDDFGHGTHVAGTIAAVGNNAAGIVGVAPAAKIMPLKGLGANGSGSEADLAAAIYYAARNGAKIINASWGVAVTGRDQTLIDAVNYAHDNYGVLFVASSGNSGVDMGSEALPASAAFYPAAALNAMAVGATTHLDALASFSNFGLKVDVVAPGGGDTDNGVSNPDRSILSLLSSRATAAMTGSGALIVGGQYLRQSGTSMAAPHVAGVAALIRAAHPSFTPDQVRAALRAATDDVGATGWDPQTGYGRLAAGKAVAVAAPLNAHLTGPTSVSPGATVTITGSASGTGFAQYRVDWGSSFQPTSWTTLATSTTQVTNGALATWNLNVVPDGNFTIRLTATTTGGQSYEDRLALSLSSVSIDTPAIETDSQFRPGASIPISGSVTSPGLTSYTLTATGAATGAVSASTFTLANGGKQLVSHGLLGTWNTTGLPSDRYTITLSAATAIVRTAETRVTLDGTLHPGFPWDFNSLGGLYSGSAEPWFGVGAYDLDGDGAAEILDQRGNNIYVIKGDGTQLAGWPQQLIGGEFEGSSMAPVAGDITGDGIPELVAEQGGDGSVLAYSRSGVMLPGWPTHFPFTGYAALALVDMDGDGVKDVVETGYSAPYINVVNGSGVTLPGWPISTGFNQGHPAIGDVDGDGKPEIVIPDFGGTTVRVYESNATLAPGWPKTLGPVGTGFHTSWPALADLDGDGKLDIVIGSADGKVYAWHGDGTAVAGWPQSTVHAELNAPAVGDVDGDGAPEVVIGTGPVVEAGATVNYLYAWRAGGTALAGWPVRYAPGITTSLGGFHAPALADVDGDGKADIVVSSDVGTPAFGLHAYRYDATEAAGFPKATPSTGSWQGNAPAIADFDGDGLLEVAWDSYSPTRAQPRPLTLLTMWDLPAPKTAPQPWPMFGHDAAKTGALPVSAQQPPLVALARTGWIATASSNPAATPVAYALDGNTATRWATGANQVSGQYFQLDLQTPQTFSQLVLDSRATSGNYPQAYQVFVSNDGVSWGAAIASGSGNTGGLTTITFTQQTARYIKIVQTGTLNHWWSIYEINVYGPAGPPPTPVALPRAGWTATASSNPAATPVTYALDGNTSTRWATGTNQVSGQYYQLDMQTPQTFSQLVLDSRATSGNYPQAYQVFVSSDGASWGTAVATGNGNASGLTTITFAQQTARYVKIVQTGTLNHWWSIYELNVYGVSGGPPPSGPLPRAGWVTTASNNASTTGNALDGNTSTRWTTGTAQTATAWYQVDMLTSQPFNQLTLDSAGSANDYPRGYAVYVSADGVSWGAPVAAGAGTNKLVTVTFPPQTARYIKIALTAAISNWWSIAELNVLR